MSGPVSPCHVNTILEYFLKMFLHSPIFLVDFVEDPTSVW